MIIMILILLTGGLFSCEEKEIEASFEDMKQMTIYDYIVENETDYSSFLKILEEAGIDKTLSAYNPDNNGYTLFLPDNQSIGQFIEDHQLFNSLDELLNDAGFAKAFSRYHVVNLGILSENFPFGALPEYTLSHDLLTVSFIIETDTSYFKINNQAPVIQPDIEMSNGVIHLVGSALNPISFTTYEWLELHDGYSVFKEALDLTGFDEITNLNTKDEATDARPFTLLLEHDSIYRKFDIQSVDDLISQVSPDDPDFTDPSNPLYNYIGYHLIAEQYFLDDFVDVATNYSTYSEIPLNINGLGFDIAINKGKEVFDTIVHDQDTTLIDYIGFIYDDSNVLTQSGAIHFIDQMMRQHPPTRAAQTFQFYEEPVFNQFSNELGSYLIEDSTALTVIRYSGTDLYIVKESSESSAWNGDYLKFEGDFSIHYSIPKIVQGNYDMILGAEAFNIENALIEILVDGNSIGGLIDLSSGGDSNNPFARIELGSIDFGTYDNHVITINSIIPGRFLWDYVRFEPGTNSL